MISQRRKKVILVLIPCVHDIVVKYEILKSTRIRVRIQSVSLRKNMVHSNTKS